MYSFFVILHENKTIYFIMRRRNFEGDYNLLFEKQSKYEESIKSYHEHNKATENAADKPAETEAQDVDAKNEDKQ